MGFEFDESEIYPCLNVLFIHFMQIRNGTPKMHKFLWATK